MMFVFPVRRSRVPHPLCSILSLIAALCSGVNASHAAEHSNRRGSYHLSYDGNFPMYLTARAGTTCEATFGSVGRSNLTFKRLFLVSPPTHGKIRLREGGYYIYSAPAAYTGPDAFTLRVCGTEDDKPGCATLQYSVTIN
jgi:hypothetical protein